MCRGPIHRDPRRFSLYRLTPLARKWMHRLALTEADLGYAFLYGQRHRFPRRIVVTLRRRDMPAPDRELAGVVRRARIRLDLSRDGWIVDVRRDPHASRRVRSTLGCPPGRR